MHIGLLCVLLLVVSYSQGALHPVSPCPSVFSYEGAEPERDRWFGTVLLSTDESLVGVRLDIKLDRSTQILVSWLGDVTTEDNERFTILSLDQKLHPGPALSSRFMVKFNSTQGSPQVRTIRLNGRQICPPDPNFPTDIQNNYPTNSMKNQDKTERLTRRPDPDFEENRGPNHQGLTTEPSRRTTKPYISEGYEPNPPKRENNFFHENTVTHSTTEHYYDSDEEYRHGLNNHDHNHNSDCNENEGNNYERSSTTDRYNNIGDDRPGSKKQQKITHKPSDIDTNEDISKNEQRSTTEQYNSDRDDRPAPNYYNQQKTTRNPSYINENEEFYTTKQYNNVRNERPGSNNYNQEKSIRKPSYTNENEGSINNERFSTTEQYNIRDDKPENNNYNQQKTTLKPSYTNENEYSNSNEQLFTTERYNNKRDKTGNNYDNEQKPTPRLIYSNINEEGNINVRFSTTEQNIGDKKPGNNYNQQKTTSKPSYKNENEGSNNNERFVTTERYNNFRDDKLGQNNYNQQKTTYKPTFANENEGNNKNERFTTTERYSIARDDKLGNNNYNQQKTTRKPSYNITNNKLTTPKPPSGSKTSSTVYQNNNKPLTKSDIGSQELHLSTNYQVNGGQSNRYPVTTSKNKNDSSTTKGINLNSGKPTRLTGKESSTAKYHKSGNADTDDLETAMTSIECGRVEVPPAPLITNGQNTARGQWPWHIALYKIEGINLSYICGGSLISSTAVITAAHCVTKAPRGRPVDADVLVVYLGKYHLYQFSDDGGVQNKQVRDVHVYPQYNNTNFHDDIAVLTLTSPVEYTTFVRPVCLWDSDDTDLNSVEGKEGTVVGWGYDEFDQVTEELKMAQMPVVSQQTCIWSYPQFFSQFTSNRTFCAGFRKETPETEEREIVWQMSGNVLETGTSVCNGDSGGGMVFSKESQWYLRGLVSITVARQGLRVCDTSHYVVFTDVAKYLDWIKEYIT